MADVDNQVPISQDCPFWRWVDEYNPAAPPAPHFARNVPRTAGQGAELVGMVELLRMLNSSLWIVLAIVLSYLVFKS